MLIESSAKIIIIFKIGLKHSEMMWKVLDVGFIIKQQWFIIESVLQLNLNGISIDLIVEYTLIALLCCVLLLLCPSPHTQYNFQLVPIYCYTSMNASHHVMSSSVTYQTMHKSINYYCIMHVCWCAVVCWSAVRSTPRRFCSFIQFAKRYGIYLDRANQVRHYKLNRVCRCP